MSEKLALIFEADIDLKRAFIHFGLLYTIAMFPNWQNNLRALFGAEIMSYRGANEKLKEVPFLNSYEHSFFDILTSREAFPESKEYLPIMLLASSDSQTEIGSAIAIPHMKATVIDTEDEDLIALIYQMIFGNYDMFFAEDNQNFINSTPLNV